jgi:nicotinamidase-related amidase
VTPPTRPVLVVVDVQNGFVRDPSRHVVPVIADLVDRWQAAGLDVVFTRYFNSPGSQFERLFGWTGLQGPPETDIVSELAAQARAATAVIDKRIYSLFTSHGRELVRSHGWTDLYVCGIATESCVLKTAADAFEQGDLTPWVIEDASAATPARRTPGGHCGRRPLHRPQPDHPHRRPPRTPPPAPARRLIAAPRCALRGRATPSPARMAALARRPGRRTPSRRNAAEVVGLGAHGEAPACTHRQ